MIWQGIFEVRRELRVSRRLFLFNVLYDFVRADCSGDDPAIGKDKGRRATDAEFLAEFDSVVYRLRVTFCSRDFLPLHCIIEQRQGEMCTGNVLRLRVGLLMHRKREKLYKESDIFSLCYDLLHLLMKSLTEWSFGVVEYDDLILCVLVAHDDRISKGY
jgi:hypothetical protein